MFDSNKLNTFEDFWHLIDNFINTSRLYEEGLNEEGLNSQKIVNYLQNNSVKLSSLTDIEKRQFKTLLLLTLMFVKRSQDALNTLIFPQVPMDNIVSQAKYLTHCFERIGRLTFTDFNDDILRINRSFGFELEPNNFPQLEIRSKPTKNINGVKLLFDGYSNLLRNLIEDDILPIDYYVNIHYNWGIRTSDELNFIHRHSAHLWLLFMLIFLPELPINRLIYKINTGKNLLMSIDDDVWRDSDGDRYIRRLQTRWNAINFISISDYLVTKIKFIDYIISYEKDALLNRTLGDLLQLLGPSLFVAKPRKLFKKSLEFFSSMFVERIYKLCVESVATKIYLFDDPLTKAKQVNDLLTSKMK